MWTGKQVTTRASLVSWECCRHPTSLGGPARDSSPPTEKARSLGQPNPPPRRGPRFPAGPFALPPPSSGPRPVPLPVLPFGAGPFCPRRYRTPKPAATSSARPPCHLFRHRLRAVPRQGYADVWQQLHALSPQGEPDPSAFTHARKRLGVRPLRTLFNRLVAPAPALPGAFYK